MPSSNQAFLEWASNVIRSDADHPLRFLLTQSGDQVMTLNQGNGNYFDVEVGAIYEGAITTGKPTAGLASGQIADSIGVSVSVDACHITTKKHGAPERFSLGIAEDNRSHGHQERNYEIQHEAIDIGGIPVERSSAEKWEAFGLLPPGQITNSAPSTGWTATPQKTENQEANMSNFDHKPKDPTQNNLFGSDIGPKAEAGPAHRSAGGGQSGDNNHGKNQSLEGLQVPAKFSRFDFIASQVGRPTVVSPDKPEQPSQPLNQEKQPDHDNQINQCQKQKLEHRH